MKVCRRCGEEKSKDDFSKYVKRNGDESLRHTCTTCNSEYKMSWQRANPDKAKNKHLVKIYGITLEDYNNMVADQNGVCAICKNSPGKYSLAVDHDHNTGEIRGLLCISCNRGIGYLQDNASLLREAANYLER